MDEPLNKVAEVCNMKFEEFKSKSSRNMSSSIFLSHFGEFTQDRAPAQVMSARSFCRKYDCKKSRRVIIKYELDN